MKMILRYEIILYWSEEDQAFIAEVTELPGCAAEGETYQEALQNVEIIPLLSLSGKAISRSLISQSIQAILLEKLGGCICC
jgi:predicted RNase H-like HicB family nuclease